MKVVLGKYTNLKLHKASTRLIFCYKQPKIKTKKTKIKQLELNLPPIVEQDAVSLDIQSEEDKELNDAEQAVARRKSKRKKIMNTGFFVLNIVVVVFILVYQLGNEGVTSFSDLLMFGLNWWAIVPILICFISIIVLDALRTNMFLKKSGNRSRPFLCYKMCAVGRYYDNITPMSTGGEPSQIFYLSSKGISPSSSISTPMARYVESQMAWIIVAVMAVIAIAAFNTMEVSVILVAGLIGFILNGALLTITLVISMSNKLGKVLVVKTLKLLQRMHIVKNYDKQYEKVMKVVSGYQTTMQTYAAKKTFFISTMAISILIYLLMYSIPFFVCCFLGDVGISAWPTVIVYSVIIDLAASFVPLPGGTGMNEISFTVLFASLVPEGTVFWGLLIWRFMTYYVYILQGIIVVIYDYFIGNKKYNWLKRKWELEAESIIFKEEQIRNYKNAKKKKKSII